jgi:hypothetical protein
MFISEQIVPILHDASHLDHLHWICYFIITGELKLFEQVKFSRHVCGVRLMDTKLNFSPHHCIQTSPGVYPASYPMGTRVSFLGGKVAEA